MATFGPQMPDVQAHVGVRQGVQDHTVSAALQLAGNVGMAAWQGKVQSDLVGDVSHMDQVSALDEYGAIEYDEHGIPTGLAVDQDLTRIANARRQGRITSERATALVNKKVREAINQNPMFAQELQQRAQRFFTNELGGGGAGSIGGNILNPTPEEAFERKIQEWQGMELAKEELAAHQLGLTVGELRWRQRIQEDREFKKSLLDSGQELRVPEVQQAVTAWMHSAEQDLMVALNGLVQEHGGILGDQHRTPLRQQVIGARNQIISRLNSQRASIGGTAADNMEANVQRWADNFIELIDSGNAEEMLQAARDHAQVFMDLQNMDEMYDIVRMYRIGPEWGNQFVEAMGDEHRLNVLASFNPIARYFRDTGRMRNVGFDAREFLGPYVADVLAEFAGELPEFTEMEGDEEDPTRTATRDFVASQAMASGRGNPAMWEHTKNMALESPETASILLTRRARAKMDSDPEFRAHGEGVFQNSYETVARRFATGEYDLSMVEIVDPSPEDLEGAHAYGRHGRSGGLWRPITNIRPSREGLAAYARARSTGDRTVAKPDDVAKQLQHLVSVAEMYPDMMIDGQRAADMVDQLLGRQPLPGIPWMRDEQIQDVEFNDQRIGGEEGSGVGGLEPADTMQVTEAQPEMPNVPATARAELEQELGNMRVSLNEGIAGIEAAPGTTGAARYNQLVGGGPRGSANLTDMTLQEVMEMQRGMIGEGHMSTAVGKYQFLRQTLNNVAQQMGLDPATTKFTPQVQEDMQNFLINQNTTILRRRNLPATSANLYLMHNLGPQSATRLLRADPSARVDTVLSEQEIRNNPALYGRPPNVRTVEEVMRNLERRFDGVPGPDDIERQMASMELIDALSHLGRVSG